MEYMKINGFLGEVIGKLINKSVEKKVGFKPQIAIKNLNFYTDENEENVFLDANLKMSRKDFEKIMEVIS